jgi:hypothetical protein
MLYFVFSQIKGFFFSAQKSFQKEKSLKVLDLLMTTETLLSNSHRGFYRFLKCGFDFRSDFLQSNLLFNLFERLCRKRGL